jgi:hypothetical protein
MLCNRIETVIEAKAFSLIECIGILLLFLLVEKAFAIVSSGCLCTGSESLFFDKMYQHFTSFSYSRKGFRSSTKVL